MWEWVNKKPNWPNNATVNIVSTWLYGSGQQENEGIVSIHN